MTRLVELELDCEADGAALPDSVKSGHCCLCLDSSDADIFLSTCHLCTQGCCQAFEAGHLVLLPARHANIFTDVVRAVGHNLPLFCESDS